MFSFKRLPCVFRMSVLTLIALGMCSFAQVQAQNQYNTTVVPQNQEQLQAQQQAASNQQQQKSGGGLFGGLRDLFKGDDDQKNTQHVAPANAAPPVQQQQPVVQQYSQPVTPPRPNSAGGHSSAPATGPAIGARPQTQTGAFSQSSFGSTYNSTYQPYQSTTSTSMSQYGTAQPVNSRPPLSQTMSGSSAGSASTMPNGTMQRMQELQTRAINVEISPPGASGSTRTTASLAGGGPPTPPSVGGSDDQERTPTGSNTSRSVSTQRKTVSTGSAAGEEKIANGRRTSVSTDDNPVETPSGRPGRSLSTPETPPAVKPADDSSDKESTDANMGKPIPRPAPKEAAPQPVQEPRPTSRPMPVPRAEEPKPVPKNDGGLMKQQSPVLSIATFGPDAMIVGKEETYKFVVTNTSAVTAEAVVLNIELPRWAESTQAPELTTGSTTLLPHNDEYGIFQWQIGQLASNKSETLKLHIVLRERRAFDLRFSSDFKQNAAQAKIDVQQPIIKMEFEGPDEVLWGEEETYRLRIRNVGNGDANNLMLRLSASGVVKGEAPIESLKVGDERILDVIVEALEQDMRELQIKVEATGPYGLSEATAKSVVIKRAVLELDVPDAPGMQYVNNTLDYVLVARNVGTATSLGTIVEATLPLGVKYVSSTNGGEYDGDTNRVLWKAGTLPVGGEFVCMVACEAKREGECRLDAKVSEKTGLVQTASAATFIEAIADVILEIEKPQDPIEAGATTEYVVLVTNRGSKAAENINVDILFSGGIEPLGDDTGKAKVNRERNEVRFDRIPALAPGEPLKFRVKARGLSSGNHKVLATLVCESTDTTLTQQVMSRFYQGRNSRTSSATSGDTNVLRGNPAPLAPGNSTWSDSRDTSSGIPSFAVPDAPTMTRPGALNDDQARVAPIPTAPERDVRVAAAGSSANTNPMASPALPSNRMQSSTTGTNAVPAMKPTSGTAFGQTPVGNTTAAPSRLSRAPVPSLPTPPPVGAP